MNRPVNIENCPDDAWNYEFIICDATDGKLTYIDAAPLASAANSVAETCEGTPVIVHNVRIQGYRDPRPMKHFCFIGKWYWDCFAHDLEEAKRKYDEEAYPEDLYISPYDDVSVEDKEGES